MTSMSEECAAFLRNLGISEDDVRDPSTVICASERKNLSSESFNGSLASEVDGGVTGNATRAVRLSAGARGAKSKPVFVEDKFCPKRVASSSRPTQSKSASSPEALKMDGNRAFEDGRYREALQCYTAAIESIIETGGVTLKEQQNRNMNTSSPGTCYASTNNPQTMLLGALFSNRSASYLQAAKQIGAAEAFESALRDADRAVELRPTWFKGYSRQGDAYFKMKRYTQAAEAYEMALQFDPGNQNLIQSVREARQRTMMEVREGVEAAKKPTSHVSPRSVAPDEKPKTAVRVEFQLPDPPTNKSFRTKSDLYEKSRCTARQLWNEFKTEVEATVQQPTGDDYRLEQLRLFREQKEREKSAPIPVKERRKEPESIPVVQKEVHAPEVSTHNLTGPKKESREPIPHEFSSAAAAAYQQRLLEEFRRKKALQR